MFCLQFRKRVSPTKTQQSHVGSLQTSVNWNCCTLDAEDKISNLVYFQIPPLCSVTLKAGSSVMLMLETSVASGIHVGSIFSGFGSTLETCGIISNQTLQFDKVLPPLLTVRHLCWGLYKREIDSNLFEVQLKDFYLLLEELSSRGWARIGSWRFLWGRGRKRNLKPFCTSEIQA